MHTIPANTVRAPNERKSYFRADPVPPARAPPPLVRDIAENPLSRHLDHYCVACRHPRLERSCCGCELLSIRQQAWWLLPVTPGRFQCCREAPRSRLTPTAREE